jgi:uncharacterized protein YaiL (DUF2058 family)
MDNKIHNLSLRKKKIEDELREIIKVKQIIEQNKNKTCDDNNNFQIGGNIKNIILTDEVYIHEYTK